MHRKNFLKVTGLSLASLILKSSDSNALDYSDHLSLPDHVYVLSSSGWLKLEKLSSGQYGIKDFEVLLKQNNHCIEVYLNSPREAIGAVRLNWKHLGNEQSKCLGDHWERTYGDLSFKAFDFNKKFPWYFIQSDGAATNCFGVKTGCNSICHWNVDLNNLQVTLDTRSGGIGVQLGKRTLHAADIISLKNNFGENCFTTGQRFCRLMCNRPRLPKQPVYGINDWYFAYGNNSASLILEHTKMLSNLALNNDNRPFSVIDAGWASYSPLLPGDCCWQDNFSIPNEKFGDMHKVAEDIIQLGMRPGLWTRPLSASYKDKPSLLLPNIPGRNEPKNPILDPTIERNLERIHYNISLYRKWGYHLVKHDYSTYDILGKWGFEMIDNITTDGWRFNDNGKTTAEILLTLYREIRRAAGDMILLGCNTLSHLSAGIFEINRIGDDTSGKEWTRTRKMGVNTLGFRMIQHKNFYEADGDCVGLTKDVPWEKNKQWMQLLAESSTPLFISAEKEALGSEQRKFIKACFLSASKEQLIGEPIDWLTTSLPAKWKLNGEVKDFMWE